MVHDLPAESALWTSRQRRRHPFTSHPTHMGRRRMRGTDYREPHIRALRQHTILGVAGTALRRAVGGAAMRSCFDETRLGGIWRRHDHVAYGFGRRHVRLFAVVSWWLAIGVVGLCWITLWTRFDPQKHTSYAGRTPFAPAIVTTGAIGIAVGVMF